MTLPPLPLMDKWSRNARLYGTLVGMGLVVRPILFPADPEKIDGFYVSSELPAEEGAQDAAVTGVGDAVKRPQVADVIATAERLGDGVVIHFPAMR